MIRVMLVDDHPVLRYGFRMLLSNEPREFDLVAEATSSEEGLNLLRQHNVDVVVVDIGLGGVNGLTFVEQITRRYPAIRTLVFSVHSDSEYAIRAIRLGAQGYLSKDSPPGTLLTAIRHVAEGRGYLSPEAILLAGRSLRRHTSSALPHEILSTREYEIFKLIIKGKKVSQIASILKISAKTASTHRVHILKKIGTNSTVGLVNYAIDHHIEV